MPTGLPFPTGWTFEKIPTDVRSAWGRFDIDNWDRGFFLVHPIWLLLTLAAISTALLWHRDRRTVKPGHCRQCGYDLRASKKICPECGTAIASPAK